MQEPLRGPYYTELATAFVRGRLGNPSASLEDGIAAGLRVHKFKADSELPRVRRVIGILRGMQPESLLDLGSGRGTFLWPMMAGMPGVQVTAADVSERRATDLGAVRRGGIHRLHPVRMDACRLGFAGRSFDGVTALEVLEHLTDPIAALAEAVRVARKFVVVSVPSVPDDNPEHLHLFRVDDLLRMAQAAGGGRTVVDHVLNHRIAVIQVRPS